jgi:glutamate--cysteine ligase catalytic subunit
VVPTNAFTNVVKLALTAASPLWRGYIADVDARWNVIAGSVDDRTDEERGLKVRAS